MTSRLAGNDQRAKEVVKHLTAMFEHVGRMLHALQNDNWDSAGDHLSLIGERATFTNMSLNIGSPDASRTLAAMRKQLPEPWADAIAAFLAGGPAPAVQAPAEETTQRDDRSMPEQVTS